MDEYQDVEPLCASTPKKAKCDGIAESYFFISDSDDTGTQTIAGTEESELLFLDPEEDTDSRFVFDSTGVSSILFLSEEASVSGENEQQSCKDSLQDCCSFSLDTEASLPKESTLGKECCTGKCLQNFSVKEFNSATEHFQSKTPAEQRQFLHDSIIFSSPTSCKPAVKESFMLCGKQVCKRAFALLLGTTERRFDRIKQNCTSATRKLTHGNQGVKRTTTKSNDASAWMKNYFEQMGDHMPDNNRIHLPSFLTKREVYQRMMSDLTDCGIKKIISLSTFYDLWERDFCHVLIPEVRWSNVSLII